MLKIAGSILFSLLVLSQMCRADEDEDEDFTTRTPKNITIDAAFCVHRRYETVLLMYSDDDVIFITDKVITDVMSKKRYINAPENFKIQAARASFSQTFFKQFYYGKTRGYYNDRIAWKRRQLKYGRNRKFLQGGGPDAAARRENYVVFFKGCKMVYEYKWYHWGKVKDIQSIGLPCHIHAAWREEDTVFALKGDKFWRWEKNNSVTGPHAFHDTYDMKGIFFLKPSPDEVSLEEPLRTRED